MTKKPTITELQEQIIDITAALQRERADAENMRRRHHEQMFSLRETVKADVVRELLPIVDNFDRALKHSPLSSSSDSEGSKKPDSSSQTPQNDKMADYVKGVEAVVKQFEKTLTDIGVERIKTVGEVFDPHLHEAVHMEDGDGNVEVVCEELQPGFKLGDEVIRHAIVKVKMEKK
jgi:molecular chaperone GrpE